MGKKVLFISPTIGGFHTDMMSEMNRQGYEVDFVEDILDKNDPDYVRGPKFNQGKQQKEAVLKRYDKYWEDLLNKSEFSKFYDILFVIDGRMLSEKLFSILKDRNPQLKSVNYLYDTTRSIYRFNVNFKYFNKVVTFDKEDAHEFNIPLLPIPWTELKVSGSNKYTFFAMGAYIKSRYDLFRFVEDIAKENDWNYYLKIKIRKITYYPIKYIANLFLRKKEYLPPSIYYSSVVTKVFMPKEEFTNKISESEVIVDSIDARQDGLTARCTWALGAEKKIITDNKSLETYDFYDPNQVYAVKDFSEKTRKEIYDFVHRPFTMTPQNREKISKFRLDNWINLILS